MAPAYQAQAAESEQDDRGWLRHRDQVILGAMVG
jgi:hypothetical protein